MRALRIALRALLRDWRSGELAVLLVALLVAVTALTAVGFFTDRIAQAVDRQAAEVLAADLRLRSPEPVSQEYDALAAERGIRTARTISFPSVEFFGADSALTAIRAVGPGYPLRGRLKISDAPFAPSRETDALPGRGEAWLDSRLLARIGAGIGDRFSIGAESFAVARVLDYRPDQGSAFGATARSRHKTRARSVRTVRRGLAGSPGSGGGPRRSSPGPATIGPARTTAIPPSRSGSTGPKRGPASAFGTSSSAARA